MRLLAERFSGGTMRRGELGIIIRIGLEKSRLRLAQVARAISNTHVGKRAVAELDSDLLPLPAPLRERSESRLLSAILGGATVPDLRRDFPTVLPSVAVSFWLWLIIVVLNYMWLGWSPADRLEDFSGRPASEAQLRCISHLREQVVYFLRVDEKLADVDWKGLFMAKQCDYTNELILKGRPVRWSQVKGGLPPTGVAATVSACKLASPTMARLLGDPMLNIKPLSQWPSSLRRTRVMVGSQFDWDELLEGLYRRNMLSFRARSTLVQYRGKYLTDGMFGVPKGNIHAEDFSLDTCVLRLILNAIPSNELQHIIPGEIGGLPQFTQWSLLELLDHESILLSGDDQVAAFFIYFLEEAWERWFVLDREASPSLLERLKLPSGSSWPCLRCIAMGWHSATGVVQHLHMQLVRRARRALAGTETLPELSKDATAGVYRYLRVIGFLETYLDDTLHAEITSDERMVKSPCNGYETSQTHVGLSSGSCSKSSMRLPAGEAFGGRFSQLHGV